MSAMEFDPDTPPTPELLLAARTLAGLTQEQAAALVHRSERKRWSEWERGSRPMSVSTYELFLLKTNLHPQLRVSAKEET